MRKHFVLLMLSIAFDVFALSTCNISNVKYISMIPQYVAPPKISECEAQIRQEAKECTQLKEHECYIDTTKRGINITEIKRRDVSEDNSHHIDDLINLLRIFASESFSDSHLFEENVTLIVFLNRYRSLSSYINNLLLEFSPFRDDLLNENVIVICGLWDPVWMLGGKAVPFEKMQDYFRKFLWKHREDNEGIELLKKIEEENPEYKPTEKISAKNRPALQQNMRSSIPFREIREALLRYAYDQEIVTSIIGQPNALFVYMAIHDSDIVHLNQLYNHYFEILNKNRFPVLASTGYQTARENHPHDEIISLIEAAIKNLSGTQKSNAIRQLCESNPKIKEALKVQKKAYVKAYKDYRKEYKKHGFVSYDILQGNILLDMRTREALSLSDPRLLYWPEPNMIFKIFDRNSGTGYREYSFIGEGRSYTDPSESSMLLHSIYAQNEQNVTAIFSSSYPVELRLNRSFILSKTFSSLPQAHYKFRNTAIIAYRQLGIESHLENNFISTFSNLYSLFSKASLLGVSEEEVESAHITPFYSGINRTFGISPEIDFGKSVLEIGRIPYGTSIVGEEEEE